MKYIKSYNESNSEGLTEDQVQNFCEMNLAYLMDDGLRILVSPDYFDLKVIDYKVTLSFRLFVNKRWGQIKDQVIPFLTHLRNGYDLVTMDRRLVSPSVRIEIIGLESTYSDWFNKEKNKSELNILLQTIDEKIYNYVFLFITSVNSVSIYVSL